MPRNIAGNFCPEIDETEVISLGYEWPPSFRLVSIGSVYSGHEKLYLAFIHGKKAGKHFCRLYFKHFEVCVDKKTN